MNQNSNSQGNLVVLLIPYFSPTKKSDVCPVRIQPSLKKTFKRCGVITLGYFAQSNANSIPPPPPPRTDVLCIGLLPEHLQCFFIRVPKDPSPTLHRFLNNFLARWTSFIDTAGNILLKSVKLPSLRAICQSKTNQTSKVTKFDRCFHCGSGGGSLCSPSPHITTNKKRL